MYDALSPVLSRLGSPYSMLFVNDGSDDSTGQVLDELFRRDRSVDYLSLSRNFGHQSALTAGLDHADADVVITMDADMQHPPELILEMVAAWRAGFDVVHTQKLSTGGRPLRESLAARVFYGLAGRLAQVPIIPHASDFRLLDRDALGALRTLPERDRLYRGLATWIGFRQCVIPYAAPRRAAGRSHYGLRRRLAVVASELFGFSNVPLYVGLVAGGAALVLSVAYLLYIVVWFVTAIGEDRPPGWVSLISATLLLNSVALVFLGVIGVYVARIYHEVRGRPGYVLRAARRHGSSDGSRPGS